MPPETTPTLDDLRSLINGRIWTLTHIDQKGRDPKDQEAETDEWRWLAANLEGLLADRARLDWLHERTRCDDAPRFDMPTATLYEIMLGNVPFPLVAHGDSLREAIDAARTSSAPRGEP